jgi:hypothetical protein
MERVCLSSGPSILQLVNQLFRGKVRDLSESEISSVVHFDFEGIGHIRVVCAWDILQGQADADSKALPFPVQSATRRRSQLWTSRRPGSMLWKSRYTLSASIFADR